MLIVLLQDHSVLKDHV